MKNSQKNTNKKDSKNEFITLKKAHDYYQKQNNTQDINSLFVFAHAKFLLTFYCTGKRKEKLIAQARSLTAKGLKIAPKNTSLLYLSLQLNA